MSSSTKSHKMICSNVQWVKATDSVINTLISNIVNLRGAHSTQLASGQLYVFLELCNCGNLLRNLRNHREDFSEAKDNMDIPREGNEKALTAADLLNWSVQIASAMEHLSQKKVIHGDIAARNVLVFSRQQVKLTDFGLSRRHYEYSVYVKKKQEPLPWRHMSVEALRDSNFSLQSDVWAFGVTMWEIFSLGEVPYPGQSLTQDFTQLLSDGLRMNCPKLANHLIYEIMASCWATCVESRPIIGPIHSKLVATYELQV